MYGGGVLAPQVTMLVCTSTVSIKAMIRTTLMTDIFGTAQLVFAALLLAIGDMCRDLKCCVRSRLSGGQEGDVGQGKMLAKKMISGPRKCLAANVMRRLYDVKHLEEEKEEEKEEKEPGESYVYG